MILTIITINYNNGQGLHKTLESVLNQTSRNFEYIVIDGGSTDNSVNTIREFESLFNSSSSGIVPFKWVSEPDNGIYHAMNKGINQGELERK
jgi:glycosyltransferase involved in cell wall biosynthesis